MGKLREILWLTAIVAVTSSKRMCSNVDSKFKIPCQCDEDESGNISVDCDYIVFEEDFPLLPFK